MADEDKESKTEEPTQRRMNESLKKGQFAKSEEINNVALLIALAFALLFFMGSQSMKMLYFGEMVFENMHNVPITIEKASYWMSAGLIALLKFLAPFFLLSVLAAVIAGGIQSGFKPTPEVLKFSPDKLNPVNGLKRLFSLKALMQGVTDIMKIVAVFLVLWGLMADAMKDPVFYQPVPLHRIPEFMYENALVMFLRVIILMSLIATVHYLYQRWQTNEDMKMTKQEVKDERKQQEGDPQMKQAQRQAAQRAAKGKMLEAVPTSDVVVTNPTHFAIALKYERGKDAAPVIVAKGQDLFAKQIKEIAQSHEVPMVENRPLARMLHQLGKVGQPIPSELYQVVADLLAYVYKTYRYYFYRLPRRRAQYRS